MKDVVASLSINPNTVLKAYRDLEQKGADHWTPRTGHLHRAASPETVGLEQLTSLRRSLAAGWLKEAAAAGLDEQGTIALFMAALRDFRDRPVESRAPAASGRQRRVGAA